MSERKKSFIALFLICTIWGATWVVSRHAILVGGFPALQLSGLRQLLAGSIFCIYFLAKGLSFPKPKEWKNLILLSILMFAMSNGLSTIGVVKIGSGLGAIIGAITALWLAIFGYFILKQKVHKKVIAGLVLGFLGVLVIFYDNLSSFADSEFTWSIVFSIIATITWALGTTYTIKVSERGNAWYNVGWQMLISGVILTALSYTQKRVPFSSIHYWGWIDLAILVLAGSIVTFICYMYVLKKLPAAQVSIYVYINPIIAVLLGHLVFEEKISATLGIGAAITLVGVYLVNNSAKTTK
jgi:drug/metabolite transporter (DMT)-like permease